MSINEKQKPKFFGFRINNTIIVILLFISLNGILNQIAPLYSSFDNLSLLKGYQLQNCQNYLTL